MEPSPWVRWMIFAGLLWVAVGELSPLCAFWEPTTAELEEIRFRSNLFNPPVLANRKQPVECKKYGDGRYNYHEIGSICSLLHRAHMQMHDKGNYNAHASAPASAPNRSSPLGSSLRGCCTSENPTRKQVVKVAQAHSSYQPCVTEVRKVSWKMTELPQGSDIEVCGLLLPKRLPP